MLIVSHWHEARNILQKINQKLTEKITWNCEITYTWYVFFAMQDTTILNAVHSVFVLARFSSDSDPGEGAEQSISTRPGHQPQHPVRNSQGPTEWPLDPSGQWESLQHGLQSTSSAGLSHATALSGFSLLFLSLFSFLSATLQSVRRSMSWLVFSYVILKLFHSCVADGLCFCWS